MPGCRFQSRIGWEIKDDDMKAIIKYPGSKWSIAKWIINFFPEHHSYLEPFFGSGAVLFNKPRSNIETVNDLDGNVVNLFEWIRRDPERLVREIYYIPYARQVYEEAYVSAPDNSLQKAANFCIRLNMGHGFRTNGERVGWKEDIQGRERAYAVRDWCSLPDRIMQAAKRLREVQIENQPAIELIRKFHYQNVLIYCDPPYMLETRYEKQYQCEMENKDHEELLDVLLDHPGPVLLSGYDNAMYNDYLKEWHREEISSRTQIGTEKREILWMNFEPENRQMNLFDTEEEAK